MKIDDAALLRYIRKTATEEEMKNIELEMMEHPEVLEDLLALETLESELKSNPTLVNQRETNPTIAEKVFDWFGQPWIGLSTSAASVFLLVVVLTAPNSGKDGLETISHSWTLSEQKGLTPQQTLTLPKSGTVLLSIHLPSTRGIATVTVLKEQSVVHRIDVTISQDFLDLTIDSSSLSEGEYLFKVDDDAGGSTEYRANLHYAE